MRTLVVVIDGRPPTPNTHSKSPAFAWATAAKWREAARLAAETALVAEGRTMLTYEVDVAGKKAKRPKLVTRRRDPRPMAFVERLDIVIVVPTLIDRDWDNGVASTKPLTDGLVEAGVMAGDSTKFIDSAGRTVTFRHEAGKSRVEYRIVEGQPSDSLGLA